MKANSQIGVPEKQGLYDPAFEKDSCGVGFIANIKGLPSRDIVVDAYEMLRNMDHRGACGCEKNTGDGSGILTGLPANFIRKITDKEFGVELNEDRKFGSGIIFFPQIKSEREKCIRLVEKIIKEQKQNLIGWREVPVESKKANIGPTARSAEPYIMQLIVEASEDLEDADFERQLYMIRKRASHLIRSNKKIKQSELFYICSLSNKIIIYKGMLTTNQLFDYFKDLRDPDYSSHIAMIHSRFSTNTFPSWDRAQPFRFMCHNGEVNTLRGNTNWMRAREGTLQSNLFGDDLNKLFPIIEPDSSDSGNFDNVLEFLYMSGRSLQESILTMIPEAWQKHSNMSDNKRSFYEYYSCLMEPWDGPAMIPFTDGKYVGAVLDRNGLRPSRYYLTHDDRIIMASEVGTLELDPALVKEKGRLQPGRIFLVDFEKGEVVTDSSVKSDFADRNPYGDWLNNQRIKLNHLPKPEKVPGLEKESIISRMQAFGYTLETIQFMLLPLISEERDPVGSMGNDSSLACLSDKPRMLYDYFRQLFAQVTNPAIDSIREEVITSLECYIGPEKNLLEPEESHCNRLRIPHPILTNSDLMRLKKMDYRGWKSQTIDITFPRSTGSRGLKQALDRICTEAEQAVKKGYSIIILSDRGINKNQVPISSLMACGIVHHHLIKKTLRTQIGIVLESGEAREVHHHCLLIGYGADAINPYLAFESLWYAHDQGYTDKLKFSNDKTLVKAYRKGVAKGILKVIGKMGISTLQSYKGAQIFEAVGLKDEVIDLCFTATPSRVQGVGLNILAEEMFRRHKLGYPKNPANINMSLPNPGEYHWRPDGEKHTWNPESISKLQISTNENNSKSFSEFSNYINQDAKTRATLRGLMKLKKNEVAPIPIEEVEPAKDIVNRFCTGAMSFGSISSEAHESLAIAMNRIGGKSNTGEGGEDSERYNTLANGDSKRSAIKQVASGRFGVTISYLTNADELQIKIAQGAKPGEGGELPGPKVDDTIARIRHSTPGVGLISPPPHHDIYSIEDLAQLIYDLKNANPSSRISVKLVAEVGVGTIAAGVAKAHADHILISGASGGTGASPLTSIKHAGLPWELGLAETHQTLVLNNLRSRVVLQTDGGLKTGKDVVIAALLGAEEMGFSTAPLITMGCIMMRKCHLNTCPVGIATQDPILRKKFAGKPEHVVNYFFLVAEEVREIMADLGFSKFNDMIGRSDYLITDEAIKHWKADGLDLSPILLPAKKPHKNVEVYCTEEQDHGLESALDNKLIDLAKVAIEKRENVNINLPIRNINRTVGTTLSHLLTKTHGDNLLPENTINIKFEGSAGQSFGAFLAQGISMELEGDANDYVGKGLSGGNLIVYPPKKSTFSPDKNIIIGNVCLYGATGGKGFFRGRAAERFCVRNSGAHAVIEGIGDHGCEYMTGGYVVILGSTGRNFAAGMSGGIAYIWNKNNDFQKNCNLEMVELENISTKSDKDKLKNMIKEHVQLTNSDVGQHVLENWEIILDQFVKVMPIDYKMALKKLYG